MSGTRVLNHGAAEIAMPPSPSIKASLDAFQWMELASAEVAAPRSPIAADLESGEISRNGAAVVITFL